MSQFDDWVVAAATELGLESSDVQPKTVLDVARDVAHQVLRPAAPVTAYLIGVAVGRGADPADAAARISALALAWPPRESETNPRPPRESETSPRPPRESEGEREPDPAQRRER